MAGQKNVRETMRCVSQQQAQKLLHNKFVVVLGDSIQRSVYKDLVLLLQKEKYLSLKQLKTKGEMSFEQDCLVEGGCLNTLHNGTQYTEVRQYQSAHHLVRFYFITRVFSAYMRSIIEDFRHGLKPDVVIASSCVWDISRYNSSWLNDYKQNLDKFFDELKSVLPEETLIIWNVTMPLGERIKGGFLVPEIQHKAPQLRYDVIEGNYYSGTLADIHGMDVLDLHYQFRFSLHHRTNDGVHWNAIAHRKITSLLLQHVAQAWGVDMPCPLKAVENTVPQPAQVNATKPAGGHQVQGTKYHYSPPADYFFNMERQPPRRNYNNYQELSYNYLSFENQHPQQVWYEHDTRAHRPALLPPPHRRHKNKHGHDGNSFHFQTLHHYEPYNENHHQQVMRSRRSRYHYAPYTHHRVNQYSHNGQYY